MKMEYYLRFISGLCDADSDNAPKEYYTIEEVVKMFNKSGGNYVLGLDKNSHYR